MRYRHNFIIKSTQENLHGQSQPGYRKIYQRGNGYTREIDRRLQINVRKGKFTKEETIFVGIKIAQSDINRKDQAV